MHRITIEANVGNEIDPTATFKTGKTRVNNIEIPANTGVRYSGWVSNNNNNGNAGSISFKKVDDTDSSDSDSIGDESSSDSDSSNKKIDPNQKKLQSIKPTTVIGVFNNLHIKGNVKAGNTKVIGALPTTPNTNLEINVCSNSTIEGTFETGNIEVVGINLDFSKKSKK